MFSKILLCSDGSEGALTAARLGAQIAQKFHSDVLLLHTYDLAIAAYPTFAAGVWELPVSEEGMDSYAEEARHGAGRAYRQDFSGGGRHRTRPCSNVVIRWK